MISFIYIAIIIAWLLLIGGFLLKDYWILCFGCLFLMTLGAYMIFYGLPGFSRDTLPSQALAFVHFGIGAYVITRGGIEVTKDAF